MSNAKRKTMVDQLQEYLEAGNKIDILKCFEMFGPTSLPSKILQLKNRGIEIESAKKADNKQMTEYWIKKQE